VGAAVPIGLYPMNRFLPLITCLFIGMAATLVSSCASYVVPETVLPPLMVPPPSAGLAYESGSAAGLHYGPPIGVRYGYYIPPPYGSYGPPPDDDDQYYPPPGGPQYQPPNNAPLYGPPPGYGPPPYTR
jgi:hypothetical protein